MSELAVISIDNWIINTNKEKNLFFNIILSNMVWMIFHFSVFYFFTFQLNSITLVWVFLWIWNLFSFLFDISIWIIQKFFRAKTLFIISYLTEIIAMLIFINFTYEVSDFLARNVNHTNLWIITTALDFFLSKWLNIILMIIACFCYWITKELQEVTLVSYILSNVNPKEYTYMLAKKNLWTWIWSFLWLILAWFILSLSANNIIFLVIFIIILIIYFTINFFDNSEKTLNLQDIYKFKVFFETENIIKISDWVKENIIKTVNKIELKWILDSSSYLFLKPLTLQSWFDIKTLFYETKKEFISIYKILSWSKTWLVLYWAMIILITFWFWDTFASTFLIKFLDSFINWWWYILLAIIAIPAFVLQDYFCKLAKTHWIYTISNFWLVLSWLSLLLMWIFSNSNNIIIIMLVAIMNSVWYASCMALAQATFLESYNKMFSSYNNLKEIDANASAAPLKIIQNLANVIWLFLWWIILGVLQYVWFFIIFWLFILWILFWTVKNKIHP